MTNTTRCFCVVGKSGMYRDTDSETHKDILISSFRTSLPPVESIQEIDREDFCEEQYALQLRRALCPKLTKIAGTRCIEAFGER